MFHVNWLRANLAFALVILLAGCAVFPGDVGKSYAAGSGCFIVAWGDLSTSTSNRSSSVSFRRLESNYFGTIGYSSKALALLNDGKPFPDVEGAGSIKIRYAAPGRYVLANPEITLRPGGPIQYTQKPRAQTEIPFLVKEGECVYLGRFLLKPDADEFVWLDRGDSDVKAVRLSIPPEIKIDTTAPQPREIGGIFVLK